MTIMMMLVAALFYLALLYTIANNRKNETCVVLSEYVSHEMVQIY